MKKVSVVVPAYNSQNTLVRCLTSLVHQTLEDIEIIVVNDASTDDTWHIMQECERQFPDKVVIVDGGINRGSGGARNQGFDLACGEYIGLVDSDDYVAPNMFELLYSKAKEGDYDMVDCGYYSQAKDKATIFSGDNVTGDLDDQKRKILIAGGGYLVTRIFRSELWNEPPVRMRENVRCLEDTEILIYMFLRAKNLGNVKEVLYNYCDNSGSATKTMDLRKYYDSIYGAIKATYELCSSMPEYEGTREAIEYAMINLYSYGINRCLYEQIARYGADIKNVKKYFDNVGELEKKLLIELAELKSKVVVTPYSMNEYVTSRIKTVDIAIMKQCDEII